MYQVQAVNGSHIHIKYENRLVGKAIWRQNEVKLSVELAAFDAAGRVISTRRIQNTGPAHSLQKAIRRTSRMLSKSQDRLIRDKRKETIERLGLPQ